MRFIKALGLVLLASTAVHAQADWARVRAIAGTDQTIRVRAVDGRAATGTVLNVDDTGVSVINQFGDVARFKRDAVQLVERRVGDPGSKARGIAKGMAWGALAGLGMSFGPALAGAEEGIPYIFAVTLGAGAGIGAASSKKPSIWIVVYTP